MRVIFPYVIPYIPRNGLFCILLAKKFITPLALASYFTWITLDVLNQEFFCWNIYVYTKEFFQFEIIKKFEYIFYGSTAIINV